MEKMKTWWIDFCGCVDIKAKTREEAIDKLCLIFDEHELNFTTWIKDVEVEED